jgi:hypothetical protein
MCLLCRTYNKDTKTDFIKNGLGKMLMMVWVLSNESLLFPGSLIGCGLFLLSKWSLKILLMHPFLTCQKSLFMQHSDCSLTNVIVSRLLPNLPSSNGGECKV